jgi:hypothetical protein
MLTDIGVAGVLDRDSVRAQRDRVVKAIEHERMRSDNAVGRDGRRQRHDVGVVRQRAERKRYRLIIERPYGQRLPGGATRGDDEDDR